MIQNDRHHRRISCWSRSQIALGTMVLVCFLTPAQAEETNAMSVLNVKGEGQYYRLVQSIQLAVSSEGQVVATTNVTLKPKDDLLSSQLKGWLKDEELVRLFSGKLLLDDPTLDQVDQVLKKLDRLESKARGKEDHAPVDWGVRKGQGGENLPQSLSMAAGETGLINVNFGGDCCGATTHKVGLAATGVSTNDFWNPVLQRSSGPLLPMKWSSTSNSPVLLNLINAPGLWGQGCGDPMYDVYVYTGGEITVTVTNLPAGQYAFYLYGHGAANNQNARFVLYVNEVSQGERSTATGTICGTLWQTNVQYVVLNATVLDGQSVKVKSCPAGSGYAMINGMQILKVGEAVVNQAPTVALTSPTPGSTFSTPVSLTFVATASDTDGSITNVQFYQGASLLGSTSTSPFTFTWTNVPEGTYSFTARAIDNLGSATMSSPVGVQVVRGWMPPPTNSQLISVNFGGNCCGQTNGMVGPAAVGVGANDYWNGVAQQASGPPVPLYYSSGTNDPSFASLSLENAPGVWSNACGDRMYDVYVYWYDSNLKVTVTGLPHGDYDVYLYGHGAAANQNGIFDLWVADSPTSSSYKGRRQTGTNAICGTFWNAGEQYVVYPDITVTPGQELKVEVLPSSSGYAVLNGLQLVQRPPSDSDRDGLPDAWELQHFGDLSQTATGDPDGDGVTNLSELQIGLDPLSRDSDANGIADGDEDSDGDGLSNAAELRVFNTRPHLRKSMNMVVDDGEYTQLAVPGGTDTLARMSQPTYQGATVSFTVSASGDTPYDVYYRPNWNQGAFWRLWYRGERGQREFQVPAPLGTEAYFMTGSGEDSDGDGLADGYERLMGLGIVGSFDSTNDGILDSEKDNDHDGLSNLAEFEVFHTNPLVPRSLLSGRLDSEAVSCAFEGASAIGVSLSVQRPTGQAILSLAGLEDQHRYDVYSRLPGSPWQRETQWMAAGGQTTASVTLTADNSSREYAVGVTTDTDGDGLPDAYEALMAGTDLSLQDTGSQGLLDTYKDPDQDHWTLYEEYVALLNPGAFDSPSPPAGLKATQAEGTSGAELAWEAARGTVQAYVVERSLDGTDFEPLATVAGTALSCQDTTLPANPLYAAYRLTARYPAGDSSPTPAALLNQAEPRISCLARVVRGPGGKLILQVSALPKNTAKLHLRFRTQPNSVPRLDFNPFWDDGWVESHCTNPTSDFTHEMAAEQLSNGSYEIPPAFAAPFWDYSVAVRIELEDGTKGPYVDATPFAPDGLHGGSVRRIPFLDARVPLRQNLDFLLRAANKNEPFSYCISDDGPSGDPWKTVLGHSDYVSAGLHSSLYDVGGAPVNELDEFVPFQENHFYRNWTLGPNELDEDNLINTGVGYGQTGLWCSRYFIYDEKYVAQVCDYVTNGGQPPPALDTPLDLWIYHGRFCGSPFDVSIGLVPDGDSVRFEAGTKNLYGLAYDALQIAPEGGGPLEQRVPGGLLYPPIEGSIFQNVATPNLQIDSYYFAGEEGVLPGDPAFSPNDQPPLLVVPAFTGTRLTGWAKQRISNGTPGKWAFHGLYFDKAFVEDPPGVRREAGILSEYGDFLPTEPGKWILTTMVPDLQLQSGECTVNAIALLTDVNHDGIIDPSFSGPDLTTAGRPFRFWINDDLDGPIEHNLDSRGLRDGSDTFITDKRDLEDFARLRVIGLPALSSADGYRVTVQLTKESGDPALRLYRAVEPDGGTLYLTDSGTANGQIANGMQVSRALLVDGMSWQVPDEFLSGGSALHFLFEAVEVGRGSLTLTVWRGTTALAATSFYFDFVPVKEMYDRAHVENARDDTFYPTATPSTLKTDYTAPKDLEEEPNLIVFVHGWRISEEYYQDFSETMFKRLWWRGYRGRFASLRWPTYSGDDYWVMKQKAFFTFNKSEYVGYRSASATKDYLMFLRSKFPNHRISVAAHSQGNAVMMQTLKEMQQAAQRVVSQYVLMQAAIPAHCYDPRGGLDYALFTTKEQQEPTPNSYWQYGQGAQNALVQGGQMVNMFNAVDFALATGTFLTKSLNWEEHQLEAKPDWESKYFRDGDAIVKQTPGGLYRRVVVDPRELMAFAARPRSKAAGAQANVHGEITGAEVDLVLEFGFDDTWSHHSGQFNRPIQETEGFYDALLDVLEQPQ